MKKDEKKLIKLLNQMMEENNQKFRFKQVFNQDLFEIEWGDDEWLWYETIFSKKFWFIEWLLKNHLLDIKKMCDNWSYVPIPRWYVIPEEAKSDFEICVESVLMYLVIQDNPVYELLAILK